MCDQSRLSDDLYHSQLDGIYTKVLYPNIISPSRRGYKKEDDLQQNEFGPTDDVKDDQEYGTVQRATEHGTRYNSVLAWCRSA